MKVKLKDLRLSLPRSPVCQKLANFSFKLPELSTSPLTTSEHVARSVCISESAEGSSPAHYERIVIMEPTPPPREVRFKDSVEPPFEETADTAVIDKKSTKNKLSLATSNALSMSLDVILKEMDEAKKLKEAEQVESHDIRVVKMRSHDQMKPSKSERMVRFASPDFDGSLTDKEISDLLSPLDLESSLDQLLQGDGLFGESQESDKAEEEEEVGVASEEGAVSTAVEQVICNA